MAKLRSLLGFGFVLISLLFTAACGGPQGQVVTVMANSSVAPWLESAAVAFNRAEVESLNGDLLTMAVETVESGEAVNELLARDPELLPSIWVPENRAWVDVLAAEGESRYSNQCVSVATSPLVIGMWQPVAESLGYPGRELGWLDIGSLAADPSAWAYYSGGQYGDTFRIGHTHPGVSGSGAETLLAIVQAAQSKESAVTPEEINLPIVQSSVGSFESAVTWFSASTAELVETMRDRGSGFLGAGIMYESDVLRFQSGQPPLIPVYPFEGTFVASHPTCGRTDLSQPELDGIRIAQEWLQGEEAQQLAVAFGLRPVNDAVEILPPLSPAQGVNLAEPKIVFADGSADSIYAVQELWLASRKPLNLVMVLDVSGSMFGDKIDSLRGAAAQFIGQMGENDYLTIMPFANRPVVWMDHAVVSQNEEEAIRLIQSLQADGGTALYDAIGFASEQIAATNSPETANVIIVLTDGNDTESFRYRFNNQLIDQVTANNTTVFTVAYGRDADEGLLEELAFAANGKAYLGDEASIASIYEEMSLAFGGAAGVGR